MRRIAIGTTALALVAHLIGCAADAPTAPKPGGGGVNNGAVQVSLFTSDANPPAGTCSLLQAVATFNGASVPEGTSIAFSTDLGSFAQNGKSTISVVTTGGAATTSVCAVGAGVANVRASATVQGKTGSDNLAISFQSSTSSAFVASCSPTFGSPLGGTALVLNGGGFSGSASTTQVFFTAAGVTREGLVTGLTSTQVNVVTPAFPEVSSLSVPAQIRILLGAGTSSPTTLTAPNCFLFSTAPADKPNITAVLPSSGKNEGNTRVAIIGSGFIAPLQVFFGPAEATVLSVSYNQIVALSPPATGIGLPNQNQRVDVRVHEVTSGQDGILAAAFQYGPALRIISFEGANVQPASGPFTPLTIQGEGFDAPVKVGLAGIVAGVMSVSATELVVLPGATLQCAGASGAITVTNINTGETASGLSFTYLANTPTISGVNPSSAVVPPGGTTLVITGTNLQNTSVTFGGFSASVISSSPAGDSITIGIPETGLAAPTCGSNAVGTPLPVGSPVSVTVTKQGATCSATLAGAFQYLLPCVP
jgi:IPT/TIG domain